MAKKTVILDCKLGKNVAGDKVTIDEKIADELISIGRASEVKADAKAKSDADVKAKADAKAK